MRTRTVAKLPRDPGPAAWNELIPWQDPWQRLEDTLHADWLVIGAGFAGLAAARRITQLDAGARVVMLEARRVGQGPAGRNAGFMSDLPHDLASDDDSGALAQERFQIRAHRHAIGFAAEMAEAFDLPGDAFDPMGKINAAATEKGVQKNRNFAAHLARLGEPSEMLDAAQMAELTGTGYYQSGLFTPGTVVLQPAMFVRGVARGLTGAGVEIYENSPVLSLTSHTVWEARTPKGMVRAPRVILAVNGHLESFGFAAGRLMHVFTYASMTRALTGDEMTRLGGAAKWGVTSADPVGTTVRRISGEGGDRIVVRNRFTFDPSMQVSDARLAAVARDHDRAFVRRFPMLRNVTMEHRWGGRLCLARNGVQMARPLEGGLFSACVQNGLGTVKGTLSGIVAAEIAAGETSEFTGHFGAEPLPQRLPPRPLSHMGANVASRWKEWRAGDEL